MDIEKIKEKLNRKLNYIGIDLDTSDVYDFLLAYLKAKEMFPNSKIETEISSSGKGFHIIIYKENTILENIFYRSLLNDDGRRLVLSLRKFFSNNDMGYFDLIFTKKGGVEVKKFDMNKILEPYKEDVNFIHEKWGTNEAVTRIIELSKKIKLPTNEIWTTCINFEGEELKQRIKQICEDIEIVDNSFKYYIKIDYHSQGYQLILFSQDKDTAHKRGMLFIKKYLEDIEGLGYWVRKI